VIKYKNTAKDFLSDERGVFAVIFGLMSIILIAVSGGVVDFVNVQNARSMAQTAIDSTTLSLQPTIFTNSEAQILALAEPILIERLSTINVSVDLETVTINPDQGTLFMEARLNVPLSFLSLVGVSNMNTRVSSQATRKQLFLEVAMVLDNSGSMNSYSRMTNLKTAASNATEILFDGAATSTTTKIGIIPFTSFVNIGANNANSPWIDNAGNSSIAPDNFDNDNNDSTPFFGPVNRLALYNQLSNAQWGGCVEARPHEQIAGTSTNLDTDDIEPIANNPDTLFVPSFSPDTPDSWAGWQSDYENDSSNCPELSGASDRERQERLCKYQGSIDTSSWGPNFDCPSTPILPLSDQKSDILTAIDDMDAGGATNIHMGAIWGYRVLSSTRPFIEGRPYDPDTKKVLIIMTDGENTMYAANNMNGAYYYSPYGFPVNERIGALGWSNNQLRSEMNNRTIESCTNAKASNIVIYTIGLDPPNSTTQSMLEDCASSLSQAFFPENPSELDDVFAQIANQLSALRIAQ